MTYTESVVQISYCANLLLVLELTPERYEANTKTAVLEQLTSLIKELNENQTNGK